MAGPGFTDVTGGPSGGTRSSSSTIPIRSIADSATKRRCTTTRPTDLGFIPRSRTSRRAARDWQTFSSREGNDHDDGYQLFQPAGDVAGLDPPDHTRLRDALHGAFRPSEIRARFEPAVRVKARRLIDRFADRAGADLARELARPLPGEMVCTWLGFPDEDHPQLLEWFGHMLDRAPGPARAAVVRARGARPDARLRRSGGG